LAYEKEEGYRMTTSQVTPKKILVIDDEPHVVRYLETLLQDNGYTTISASNGKEGLERVKEEKPDLVCLDITMPETTGIRFYRDLKEDPELAAIPIVIVTALTGFGGDADAVRRFLSTRRHVPPPDGFIAKPIDQQALLDTVAKLVSA
jgi:CheY-like chemotaxis protein